MSHTDPKIDWRGKVLSVQPRIRLTRSFDQRSHSYLGYVLRVQGEQDGQVRGCVVAIGKAAQAKHGFRVGDEVAGKGRKIADERMETAELYKVSGLKLLAREEGAALDESNGDDSPPFLGPPPTLEVYRARGHRRLAARTYATKCTCCIWGCEMPVEMIIDHWNPTNTRYRRETFCYGPKSCSSYAAGPTRKVPGRRGMSYEEEDWIDEDATAHRGLDD